MSITKLKLNADIKDIGRIITANPQGDATEQLTKLGINGTIYEVVGNGGGGVATITKAITPDENEETFNFDEEFTAEEFDTIFKENAILECVYAPVEGYAQNLYLYKIISIQQVDEENNLRMVILQATQEGMTFSVSITNADGEIGAEFSVVQPLQLENYTFNANDENWSDIELDFSNRVNRVDNLQNAIFIVNYSGVAYYGRAENSEVITFKLNENTTRYFNIANGTFNDVLSDNELNLNYMGAWVSDNEYFKNDLVLDTTDNQIYICVNEIIGSTTAPSSDNANWHVFIPTANVFIGVEISDVPSTATQGTLTETQLDLLTKNDNNYIMFAHEKYYLNDKGHTEGFLTYSHLGATSDNIIAKTITITLSTRAWVLLEEQVGGSGGGTEIIDITSWSGSVPEEYRDVERLKNLWFIRRDDSDFNYYIFKYAATNTTQDQLSFYCSKYNQTGWGSNTAQLTFPNHININTTSWVVSIYGAVYQTLYKINASSSLVGKPIATMKTFSVPAWQITFQVAAQSVDFNELLSIPNTATNGTITSDMLATLQLSDENYIIFNNEIYLLQDKNTTDGFLVYTHNGHDSNNNYFQKCITITISTLGWVLNATQLATTSDIDNAIGNALQGDY